MEFGCDACLFLTRPICVTRQTWNQANYPIKQRHLNMAKKLEIPSSVQAGKHSVTADVQIEGQDNDEHITCLNGIIICSTKIIGIQYASTHLSIRESGSLYIMALVCMLAFSALQRHVAGPKMLICTAITSHCSLPLTFLL